MSGKGWILDPSEYDLDHIVGGLEEIRKYNPQRHEMEQLTAIVLDDPERNVCVGYKDVSQDEFWVRGHMPGAPLMPGVIMCEAAAQLSSYYAIKHNLLQTQVIGLGGLDDIRIRDSVVPGDRLVIVVSLLKFRPGAMLVCQFQGFVQEKLVVEGKIKGIALPIDAISSQA